MGLSSSNLLNYLLDEKQKAKQIESTLKLNRLNREAIAQAEAKADRAQTRQQKKSLIPGKLMALDQAGVTDPAARFGAGYHLGSAKTSTELAGATDLVSSITGSTLFSTQAKTAADQAEAQRKREVEAEKLAIDTARVNLLGMTWDRAQAFSKANRDIQNQAWVDETTLRTEFNKDPVIQKAGQAVQAYNQLENLAIVGDAVAMQAAITAIAQIQEPGLAVREDDRLAYSGQNPFIEQMVNGYNRIVDKKADPGTFERLQHSAKALIIPHLKLAAVIKQDYMFMAERKNLIVENVIAGLGYDPTAMLTNLGQVITYEDATNK